MRKEVVVTCYSKDGKQVNSRDVKVPLHICEAIHRISENVTRKNAEKESTVDKSIED